MLLCVFYRFIQPDFSTGFLCCENNLLRDFQVFVRHKVRGIKYVIFSSQNHLPLILKRALEDNSIYLHNYYVNQQLLCDKTQTSKKFMKIHDMK
ncbi:unnamed protein product [Brugia timori]|uniref:Uncharacterized protein n=1 Tax=Brugia timori TaxID=42155 RepID=A0A3P7V0Q8_9BILA|nr:unnamed protein product [Brugia timori]